MQLRYFVRVVSEYQTDFVLLPEYVNAALMAHFHTKNDADAVRNLRQRRLDLYRLSWVGDGAVDIGQELFEKRGDDVDHLAGPAGDLDRPRQGCVRAAGM